MPSRYGGLGFGRGHNVDPEKAKERAKKAAAARWADPEQHTKASEPRGPGKGGRLGQPGHIVTPEQQAKMYEARWGEGKPRGPGSGTPRGPRRRRAQEASMPVREEHALRREAREKFPDDEERQDAYVYGTMRKQGWKPEHHSPWDGKTYRHWYWGVMKV